MKLIFESLNENALIEEGLFSRNKKFTEDEAKKAAEEVNAKLSKIRGIVKDKVGDVNSKLRSILELVDDSKTKKKIVVKAKGNKIEPIPLIHIKDKNILLGILIRLFPYGDIDDTSGNHRIYKVTTPIREAINKELAPLGLKCELRMTGWESIKEVFKFSWLPKSQMVSMYILKK